MIMMHVKKTLIRFWLAGLLIGSAAIVLGGTINPAVAQDQKASKPAAKKRSENVGRDPFRRYEPPPVVVRRIGGQIMPPTIQERIVQYKAHKVAAMNARMPAPKPTTALLLSEIQVIGISRTPRGYAAIVEATPIKLSYVIYPGEPFYDGQLVAIEDNKLVFRHETVFTDGRRQRSVELKALRQVNPGESVTATTNTASAGPEADTSKKVEDKPVAAEKP